MPERPDDLILAHGDRALRTRGDTPEGAHWPNQADRLRRFDVMLDLLGERRQEPVLLCDLGCGTGELLAHIRRRGLANIDYLGVDRSELALAHARQKFPGARFLQLDVNDGQADLSVIECDYLVANGLFTAKWELSQEQMQAFLEDSIRHVWPVVRRGLAFNVMSRQVDWERDDLFHMGMDELGRFLHGLAGRRITLRADYGLYEYTAYAYKDALPNATGMSGPAIDLGSVEQLQQARQNHVYQAQMIKDKLLAVFPVAEAFARYRQALELPDSLALYSKRLLAMGDAGRAVGLHFSEYASAGEPFVMAAPRVVGDGNQRSLAGRARAGFVTCFGSATVRSRSSAIELEDALILDFADAELAGIDDRLNLDPAIFQADTTRAWTIVPAGGERLQLDQAFCLVGTHSWAFGHWLWEYLPRYVAATMGSRLPTMPVLVDQGMPAQHRQALQALLLPGVEIIELPAQSHAFVARLWCAPTPMYMPLFERMNERFRWELLAAHPQRFAELIAEMSRRLPEQPGGRRGRRLFFARRPALHRKLLNHASIEALAIARGFELVYPEDLDFEAQVQLARSADWIVGPEGSAMFLCLFARPGTRLCILNHPYTLGLPVLTGLLEAVRIEVTVLTGPAMTINTELPHFVDYRIDPETFERFLSEQVRGQ